MRQLVNNVNSRIANPNEPTSARRFVIEIDPDFPVATPPVSKTALHTERNSVIGRDQDFIADTALEERLVSFQPFVEFASRRSTDDSDTLVASFISDFLHLNFPSIGTNQLIRFLNDQASLVQREGITPATEELIERLNLDKAFNIAPFAQQPNIEDAINATAIYLTSRTKLGKAHVDNVVALLDQVMSLNISKKDKAILAESDLQDAIYQPTESRLELLVKSLQAIGGFKLTAFTNAASVQPDLTNLYDQIAEQLIAGNPKLKTALLKYAVPDASPLTQRLGLNNQTYSQLRNNQGTGLRHEASKLAASPKAQAAMDIVQDLSNSINQEANATKQIALVSEAIANLDYVASLHHEDLCRVAVNSAA